MKKVVVLILICLFFGCNKKEDSEVQKPYIISVENKEIIHNNDTVPPPPPVPGWLVYGTNTFILNSDSTAYYFQNKEIGMICGTLTSDTIPYFINLQPKDLIEVSNKNIYDFIKLNYKEDFRNITFIASHSDTLNSKFFFDLQKSLNFFKRNRDFYLIRRTTQEEDTVLKYKKSNKYYDSNSIIWDKSSIKFPEKFPEQVKFVKQPTTN